MSENPYQPSAETSHSEVKRPILFILGFWVSVLCSFLTCFYALVIAYANLRSGGPMPAYIIAMVVLMPCCSVEFAVSAYHWRRGSASVAMIMFASSLLSLLIVPAVLRVMLT